MAFFPAAFPAASRAQKERPDRNPGVQPRVAVRLPDRRAAGRQLKVFDSSVAVPHHALQVASGLAAHGDMNITPTITANITVHGDVSIALIKGRQLLPQFRFC